MKRLNFIFAFLVVLLLGAGVFAQSLSTSKNSEDFAKDVAVKKGVDEEKITSVEEVDMNSLPDEVKIENIDETTLAMYKIDVEGENPIFVITASDEKFKKEVQNFANRVLLNFGLPGKVENSTFLLSSTGVPTSYESGYVMIRDGSITGLSTSLNVEETLNGGKAEIILYKNGKPLGFRNTFDMYISGYKTDYDTMKEDTLNFEKGDVISARIAIPDEAIVSEVNVLLEMHYGG